MFWLVKTDIRPSLLFPLNHLPLSFASPMIFSVFSGGTYDSMARYKQRDWVGSYCRTDCTAGFRLSDMVGDGGIGGECSGGNLKQFFPDLYLEISPLYM